MVAERSVDSDELVPVKFDGHTVYIAARPLLAQHADEYSDERQIVARHRRIEDVLDGIAGFANQAITSMQTTNASKITLEFGCEIAVESGSFVAVIGKASAKSTMTVSLEWTSPRV